MPTDGVERYGTSKTVTADRTVEFLHYDGIVLMFVNGKLASYQN